MTTQEASAYQASERGAWVSLIAYLLLSAAKLAVGYGAHSTALVADGVNNVTDVVASLAVLIGLRIARLPADADHRYGHQRAETLAAVFAAVIMGLVGLNVGLTALRATVGGQGVAPSPLALGVALAAALVMAGVYVYNVRLARVTGSRALLAAAYDNRSDALVSLGAAVGIVGAQLGVLWLDPLAGVVVAALIVKTSWEIGYDAAHALLDGFDEEKLQQIRHRVSGVEGVVKVRDLKARSQGVGVVADVTIAVNPQLTVAEGHQIADRVEGALIGYLAIEQVLVHVEPARARQGA